MQNGPKWATPERQRHLVSLFERSGGFCVFGHKPCQVASHHYEHFVDDLVKDWQGDDRALSIALWQSEQRAIHNLCEIGPQKGEFNAISRTIWFDKQPEFYLVGLGMSGLTFTPFAKVRLASSYMNIHVDLGDTLRKVGKVRKRKAIRYGKPLPDSVQAEVDTRCKIAVREYLAHR